MANEFNINVGVLAFHGAFIEHKIALEEAFRNLSQCWTPRNCVTFVTILVKRPEDFKNLDGLVIPGGESTVMSTFMGRQGFMDTMTRWLQGTTRRKPYVWGTCAGLILLANTVEQQKEGGQLMIGGMDITTSRNIFMRQNVCYEDVVTLLDDELRNGTQTQSTEFPGVFINPPEIKSVNHTDVVVLAEHGENGVKKPIAVQQGHLIAASFHPELTNDYRWHEYFIKQIYNDKINVS